MQNDIAYIVTHCSDIKHYQYELGITFLKKELTICVGAEHSRFKIQIKLIKI